MMIGAVIVLPEIVVVIVVVEVVESAGVELVATGVAEVEEEPLEADMATEEC